MGYLVVLITIATVMRVMNAAVMAAPLKWSTLIPWALALASG